jgi:hypothetical protein
MNIFKWLWEKISNAFIAFVKEAVDKLTQKLIAELKDYAVEVVTELASTDLTNAQKRKEAFDKLVAEAKEKGLEYKDSAINLLIELAVAKLKKDGE